MFKGLLLALSLIVATGGSAFAQVNGTAGGGYAGAAYDNAPTQDLQWTQNNDSWPQLIKPMTQNNSNFTRQHQYQSITNPLPTSNGMPLGSTYFAPTSIGLQTQYKGRLRLPPTHLDSLVVESGWADDIYGDEGTTGPPPLDDFRYINDGINSPELTTRHHDASLPSAWGTPLKYGSMEGVIQGDY